MMFMRGSLLGVIPASSPNRERCGGPSHYGELLRTAEENGIEVLFTGDQTLLYEQNLTGRRLAIVALSANNWPTVKNYFAEILAAIDSAVPGSFQAVDCGAFSRRKAPDE